MIFREGGLSTKENENGPTYARQNGPHGTPVGGSVVPSVRGQKKKKAPGSRWAFRERSPSKGQGPKISAEWPQWSEKRDVAGAQARGCEA